MDANAVDPSPLAHLRSRAVRGSYSRQALKDIFKASPMAHCAYLHPGNGLAGPDGDERPRILNLPLLVVLREYMSSSEDGVDDDRDDSTPEDGELVVYLHRYVEQVLTPLIPDRVLQLLWLPSRSSHQSRLRVADHLDYQN